MWVTLSVLDTQMDYWPMDESDQVIVSLKACFHPSVMKYTPPMGNQVIYSSIFISISYCKILLIPMRICLCRNFYPSVLYPFTALYSS